MTILHVILDRVRSLPPHLVWHKVKRRIIIRTKRDFGYLRARLPGAEISENDFLNALGGFSDHKAFLKHLIVRDKPVFFLDFTYRQEFVSAVRGVCPEAESLTLAAADQVCDHIFGLLGSGPMHLGEHIDWHVDFKTGHQFNPRQYYADIQPASYPGGYDIKVPWELSRCQHFVGLGQAYWLTNDEKYPQEFMTQVIDWIESNPYPWGVNWACTMDVGIRVVNWLWGYHFFKESSGLPDEFQLTFYKSLLIHGRHILRNLENQGEVIGNHYLSNLLGLIYLGILCPEFQEAQSWQELGLLELEQEMFKQVYLDGVSFEASTSYHRLVTEMFVSATILAQQNGYSFSSEYMARLEKMVEFVMYLTRPDGTSPLIGDNDNGRLHRLKVWDPPEQEWVNFRYLLAIGAVLFERDDLARAAGDQWEEAFWLLGQDALMFKEKVESKKLPRLQLESRAFTDAGLYIMRHQDYYLAVGAGPNGQNGIGGHAHNDALSFNLYANGQQWVVDPGTYVYTADYEARNRFRSTAFHNTVMVDGQEQNPFSSAKRDVFRLPDSTQSQATYWSNTSEFILFVGEHRGYTRLLPPVIHKRTIFFDKLLSIWIIHDQLLGREKHHAATYLHFAPGLYVQPVSEQGAKSCIKIESDKSKIFIRMIQGGLCPPVVTTGIVAPGYGMQKSAPAVEWIWDDKCQESVLAITINTGDVKKIETAYRRYCEVCKDVAIY